jgi:hypothetical protein
MNTAKGIEYKVTGQRVRGQVQGYHRKPDPLNHARGAKHVDVAGLKASKVREELTFDGMDYAAKYTIGFEVEKNQLHRNAVHEYELFCGFETDGSCGYEAVTHILPLLPASTWRTKVFDMMHKAEKIVDDRFSPSDKRCGGHITIAVQGMDGDQLREAVRKNCGIVLALWRKRLNTKYCGANRRMQANFEEVYNSWGGSYEYNSTGNHRKYQTALVKGNCLEFRLPSRVQSVKQMMRRYELFYEVVRFTIQSPNGSHEALLKTLRPILLSMYEQDAAKVDEITEYARHFKAFILKNKIDPSIAEFLQ